MAGAIQVLPRSRALKFVSASKLPYRIRRQSSGAFSPGDFSDLEALYKEAPEYFNFARDVLDNWSQKEKDGRRPSSPALWWVGEHGEEVQWGFEELGFLSRKAAGVLSQACGLHQGDRVLVILPRVPEWWLITVGCIRAGIVFIPATILLTVEDIQYRLQISKAKCIITNDVVAPLVDSVASECPLLETRMLVSKRGGIEGWLNFHALLEAASDEHPPVQTKSQDPMTIYFSSGTTGYPKMVEHSCTGLSLGLTAAARYWMNLTPSDTMWGLSDTGWIKFTYCSLLSPWILGATIFSHGMLQFKPTVVLNSLAKYPVTTFCGTPTIFRMLLQHDVSRYTFKSLKTCLSGGEPINPEVIRQWKAQTGVDIYEGYGQTETKAQLQVQSWASQAGFWLGGKSKKAEFKESLVCFRSREMKFKPGYIGKPCPPFQIQIIDEDCNQLPPGKEGDIAIRIKPERPLGLFSGYVDDPEKTASTERGDFYITGDRGIMDEDGYIQFVSRADDIILSSGYRIGPFEVEHALSGHPAVAESAVVSSPDPIRGEVVKAFIILSPAYQSHDKEQLTLELQKHVKEVTAPYKYPRKIEFVQDLPKTISGKVQRKVLRQKEWEKV